MFVGPIGVLIIKRKTNKIAFQSKAAYLVTLSYNLDLDPMTSILDLDLDSQKMYMCTKIEVCMSRHSIVRARIRHTETQTDRQTRLKHYYAAFAGGRNAQ